MSNRHLIRPILLALLAVAVAAAIGVNAYHAGVAHGLVESGRLPAGPVPYPYAYGWRPWGFGFGIFPFFWLIAFFFIARALFWRRPWGWRYHGYDAVPPAFDEWHRRAHQSANQSSQGQQS
jgi:hypothetical protein